MSGKKVHKVAMAPSLDLGQEFDGMMEWLCDECVLVFGVRPVRFEAMVSEMRGVAAAKRLLRPELQARAVACEALQNSKSHLHLTLEYFVVQNRYKPLFSDSEIKEAEMRLSWITEAVDRDHYTGI